MNQPSDSQLLRAYSESRSEKAFAELVRRYVDFTYSAALRMVRDPHLAEDVTQATFAALADNAARLMDRSSLYGWLHRTAQNIAAQTVRTIERRRARERKASVLTELHSADADFLWENIAPHLDAAMSELEEPDRTALLLRFFEKKSARAMAAQLGISDEAAQKRVNRAVARLRALFAKRGVAAGMSGLVVVLGTNAVQSAPSTLTLKVSSAVGFGSTTAGAAATLISSTQAIAMTTLQKALVTAIFATLTGVGIHEAREAAELRAEVESLRRSLTAQTEPGSLAASEGARKNRAMSPDALSRLREEMNQWKTKAQELLRQQSEANSNPEMAEVKAWYARADQLKKFLQLNPGLDIPELGLATRKDWMYMTRGELTDERDYRRALSELRTAMVDRFWTDTLMPALEKYLAENGQQFPSEVALLQPYFKTPVDEALIQRYEVKPNANRYFDVQFNSDYVIRAKAVDEDFDPLR